MQLLFINNATVNCGGEANQKVRHNIIKGLTRTILDDVSMCDGLQLCRKHKIVCNHNMIKLIGYCALST
jgi:hypothetical protein